MKTKLLLIALLAGTSMFAGTHFSVGFGVGSGYYAPPPPPPAYYAPPPAPGDGYTWVGGYYYPVGPRYVWHAGYWARPPYARAYWVGPRYYGHRYYRGYWRR
jgi:hypothetical protein